MRKLMLIIVAACFTQCKTIKTEITNYKANKEIIEKKFPNSYAAPVVGYNDLFTVANSNHVYQVKLKNQSIVTLDTLKSFSNGVVVSRN